MAIYLEHKHLHIHNIFKPFIEFILGFCFAVSEAENCKNYPRLRNKKIVDRVVILDIVYK